MLLFVLTHAHSASCPHSMSQWSKRVVWMQAHYRDHGKMEYARSVLTLHNMAYQGRGPFDELHHFEIPDAYRGHFFLDDPVGGEHMNIMKAGIITASRVVAVSAGCVPVCLVPDISVKILPVSCCSSSDRIVYATQPQHALCARAVLVAEAPAAARCELGMYVSSCGIEFTKFCLKKQMHMHWQRK